MKAAKKSQKKAHKASRRKSHKRKRTSNKKKVGHPMEISPIHHNGSLHNLEDSMEISPHGSVHSFSNMASHLDGGPSPSSRNTTIESMDVDHSPENDDSMDIDELHTHSPSNRSTNTTRDRSFGGSKKKKRASRKR
jgi:hypothetical protein